MTRNPRIIQILLRVLLMLAGVFAAVVLVELALRINDVVRHGSNSEVSDWGPFCYSDPVVGEKIMNDAPGHDHRGFRNAQTLNSADIVALGDSQTYGWNVDRDQAWPQQLGALGHLVVYNTGIAGYGPGQYYTLSRTVLTQIKTKTMVVAISMDNDLVDAATAVYVFDTDFYSEFRRPSFDVVEGKRDFNRLNALWKEQYEKQNESLDRELARDESALELFFRQDTKVYWWLANRNIIHPQLPNNDLVAYPASRQWALDHPQDGLVLEADGMKTVLTTSLVAAMTDPRDPVVAEGLWLTESFLDRIAHDQAQRGVNLLVLIIPTKPLVYAESVQRAGMNDSVLDELVNNELGDTESILGFCSEKKLTCISLLRPLRNALESGKGIYPISADGHLSADGQAVVAQVLLETLRNLGWVEKH